MRSVFFVLALVVLSVLAFSSPVQSTTVPYTLCSSTAKYHIKITSLSSDVWPPKKGGHVNVTVNGTTDEAVSSGSYTAKVSYLGLPISTQNGNLSDFKPLPWPAGELDFSYVEAIPDSAPNGKSAYTDTQRTRGRGDGAQQR